MMSRLLTYRCHSLELSGTSMWDILYTELVLSIPEHSYCACLYQGTVVMISTGMVSHIGSNRTPNSWFVFPLSVEKIIILHVWCLPCSLLFWCLSNQAIFQQLRYDITGLGSVLALYRPAMTWPGNGFLWTETVFLERVIHDPTK